MYSFETYLQKHSFHNNIEQPPNPDLSICVVIPCYNEPDLIASLASLYNSARPQKSAEVIVVINAPENSDKEIILKNEKTFAVTEEWIVKHPDKQLKFHLIMNNRLPTKHAGVGLARKIGMDEAVYRFQKVSNLNGIILGFDADSICDSNYFLAIEEHFKKYPYTPGASLYFEHPLEENSIDPKLQKGIIQYELHLRYLVQALRYCGHPFAFHTVGSSFAVKAQEYVRQGGMNKRQAGEDFYFLQKIIVLGNYTEINTSRIIPSPRISDRVPFGTGASMRKFIASDDEVIKTYSFETFKDLKLFFSLTDFLYTDTYATARIISDLAPSLKNFLYNNDCIQEINSIKENTSDLKSFRNRFFRWFNVFRVIKYLNYTIINDSLSVPIREAASELQKEIQPEQGAKDLEEMLFFFRKLDRQGFGFTYQQR